jgi:hypothetical protein
MNIPETPNLQPIARVNTGKAKMRKEICRELAKWLPRIGQASPLNLSVLVVPVSDRSLQVYINLAKRVLEVVRRVVVSPSVARTSDQSYAFELGRVLASEEILEDKWAGE